MSESPSSPATRARRFPWPRWSWPHVLPVVATICLTLAWGRHLAPVVSVVLAVVLIADVLASVHHAEVVAHRVGEPFGSLVLAIAVTVIEVGLIVMLTLASPAASSTLARDSIFAVAMLTLAGVAGLSLFVSATKYHLAEFNAEGAGSALGAVILLTGLTMILPDYTAPSAGVAFTPTQLTFVAIVSLLIYGLFVFTQTIRHKEFFVPPNPAVEGEGEGDGHGHDHAATPPRRKVILSLVMLLIGLEAVVGLAKVESASIESAVRWLGFPQAVVGVIIAILVLLPESIAAVKAALRDQVQISLNLAYGSAMASIGLTIPVLSLATIWLPQRLLLGLQPVHIALFAITAMVSILTVVPGRAKTLHGGLLLVLCLAFIFLTFVP